VEGQSVIIRLAGVIVNVNRDQPKTLFRVPRRTKRIRCKCTCTFRLPFPSWVGRAHPMALNKKQSLRSAMIVMPPIESYTVHGKIFAEAEMFLAKERIISDRAEKIIGIK
jgi:hypothetical protein